jgi:hypothetical protein
MLAIAAVLVAISGCREEPANYPVPGLLLLSGSGSLSHDTTLMLSDTAVISLVAETGSDQPLTLLHTTVSRDTSVVRFDSALFTKKLEYRKTVIKGIAGTEKWSFYVRDRFGRQSPEVSVTLRLDSSSVYGRITTLPSVRLGAQKAGTPGSFCALPSGTVYTLAEAFSNQDRITLACYFDTVESDAHTIASPGANIDPSIYTGDAALANWTIRNTTRFEYRANIGAAEFEAARNDSLILASTFEFETGKRKAKNLAAGQVYAFVTDRQLRGLFMAREIKGEEVRGQEFGSVEISVKMKK